MQHVKQDAYLNNLAAGMERQFDYRRAQTMGGWESWQQSFRETLRCALGMHLIAVPHVPLQPRCVETVSFDTYTREKWYITSEPGIEIPFYLLLPRGEGPFPLVLTPHGHGRRGKETYVGLYGTEEERQESEAGERDIALQAVAEGYAVIAPDVRGFWEMALSDVAEPKGNNSCEPFQRAALMHGRTLIGERVHDMGRLIDYAETRPEIDTSRITITGNSGGGTVSLFTAALDERIGLAAPGSYFCTFAASILPLRHCSCNFIPGMMQLGEMYDVAALIAPRPLLIIHGEHDAIYPIAGTREAFAHVQRVYEERGAANRCELFVGDGGHRYYKARMWPFLREQLEQGGLG